MKVVEYTMPIRLVSEANQREHWAVKAARVKKQKQDTALLLAVKIYPFREQIKKGAIVTITRIAPRSLDSDNRVGSGKNVRDSIAKLIGVNDKDPIIEWRVLEEKGPYATRVKIETRDPVGEEKCKSKI